MTESLEYAMLYASNETQASLTGFINRYVDREKRKRYILMGNSFVCETKYLPMEAIGEGLQKRNEEN